ncbi:MAG: hypothetical protein H6835_06150 [Planctomycetes bacterium]|nr:hypothetical protein [Planctomycetota bacterium]
MTGETDEPDEAHGSGAAGPRLRAVQGPLDGPGGPPPEVRLLREFKGLTVADLGRDEILARLPGQVRSALRHIERGELDAAERALPGHFAKVLEGPRPARSRRWGAAILISALAVVTAALLSSLLTTCGAS